MSIYLLAHQPDSSLVVAIMPVFAATTKMRFFVWKVIDRHPSNATESIAVTPPTARWVLCSH
jgi:hypothetical protein